MNYLKKILGELAMVLDQVEAELEKRKLEYQGMFMFGHELFDYKIQPWKTEAISDRFSVFKMYYL